MKKPLYCHDWKPKQTVARPPACVWSHKPGLQRHQQHQRQRRSLRGERQRHMAQTDRPIALLQSARDPEFSLLREGRNPPYLYKPLNLACNCAPSDAKTSENKRANGSPASLLSFLRPVVAPTLFIRISSRDSRFNPLCLSSSKSSPMKSQSSCFLHTEMKKSLSERKA